MVRNLRFFRLAAALVFMAACRFTAMAAVDSHLVTRVEVVCRQEDSTLFRQYTGQKSMQTLLTHLRLARYAGLPEQTPLLQKGYRCRVTVHLADGGSHIYDVIGDRYLSRNRGPWELAEFPKPLPALLRQLPSDP